MRISDWSSDVCSSDLVPARAAAGLRVGCNDLHAGFDEVVPILDVLGIALADEEYNGRCVWRAIVGQAALPILWQRFGFVRDGIDVVGKRKGDDVCLQAVNNKIGRASCRERGCTYVSI